MLPTIGDTLEVTTRLNATPTISFSMSTLMAGKMPDDGFIVGVEYAVGNGRYQPLPQHDRFIVTEDDSDDVDPSKVINFRGESYMMWLMAHTYVHWSKSAKNNQRTITGNAGYLMRAFINEAKGRGWGSQLTFDFTNTRDSNNVAWTSADSSTLDWQLLTPVTQVVEKITDAGMCDWTVEGHNFRLFRYNTLGSDKTEMVLGKSVHRAPIKTDMSQIFTNLTVVPEKARNWLYLSNPAAPSKYGRLEATMTQSGVKTHAEATKLAQPSLLKGRTIVREESFEYSPTPGALTPWEDYNLGDRLSVRVRGEKIARRVIGIIARMENGTASVQTVVGDPISSTMKKALDRVGAASVGDIIGGTGDSFPATPGPSPLEPSMPNNLRVTANTSEWVDGYQAVSHVTLEWEAVTEAVDETEIDISQYEVWSRVGADELRRDIAIIGNKVTIHDWEPGVERIVVVRAQSTTGAWSEYSLELPVTPDYPVSIVPKAPTGLTVTSNTGEFTANGVISTVKLSWTAVTESTDDEPIEVVEYELWSDNAPGARVSETKATITMPAGVEESYQVRALTKGGQWGDLSTELEVTGALPSVPTRAPVAPTLTTGGGNVFARWNGSYVSGGTVGAYGVAVEARVGSSGTWLQRGLLTGAGEQIINLGVIGDTVQVRLVAKDVLNRTTGTSTTASIVVTGIERVDFDTSLDEFLDGLEGAVTDAQTTANNAQTAAAEAAEAAFLARALTNELIRYPDFVQHDGYDFSWARYSGTAGRIGAYAGSTYLFQGFDPGVGFVVDSAVTWRAFLDGGGVSVYAILPGQSLTVRIEAPVVSGLDARVILASDTGPAVSQLGSQQILPGTNEYVFTNMTGTGFPVAVYLQFPATDGSSQAALIQSVSVRDNTQVAEAQARADEAFDEAVAAGIAAGNAQTAANDKNRVWYQGTAPAGTGHKINDVWFNTANDNQISRWDGSGWVVEQFGTDAIANLSITNALIANLDAAKITTGELDSARIAANSITANKVAIGDFQNYAVDIQSAVEREQYPLTGQFTYVNDPDNSPMDAQAPWLVRLGTGTGYITAPAGETFRVNPGDSLLVSFKARRTNANASVTLNLRPYDAQGIPLPSYDFMVAGLATSSAPNDEWVEYRAVGVVPEGAYRLQPQWKRASNGQTTGSWLITDPVIRRAVTGELLVDGSVTARTLSVDEAFADAFYGNEATLGKIYVDHLEPAFGENLDISANGEIQLRVTKAELASELSDVGDDIDAAYDLADATSKALADQQAVFVITSTGAEVRSTNSPNKFVMSPEGAAIMQGEQEVSTWYGGVFKTNEIAVTERAQLGNHVVETSGTRTVFRPL